MNYDQTIDFINKSEDFDLKQKKSKELELIKKRTDFNGNITLDSSKKNGTIHKRLDITKMSDYKFSPSITLSKGIDLTIESYCNEQLGKSFKSLV